MIKVHLVKEDKAMKAVTINENEKAKVGKDEGGCDGELDHHIIGAMGEGIEEDEMGGGGDEDTYGEKEGPKVHYILSIKLVDAYPPKAIPEALKLVVNAGEAACVQCLAR